MVSIKQFIGWLLISPLIIMLLLWIYILLKEDFWKFAISASIIISAFIGAKLISDG